MSLARRVFLSFDSYNSKILIEVVNELLGFVAGEEYFSGLVSEVLLLSGLVSEAVI